MPSAQTVGESTGVEHLKEGVPDLGMRPLDLVVNQDSGLVDPT